MNLLEQLGLEESIIELQNYADTYGIEFEDFETQNTKAIKYLPTYIIKFSLPESWEDGVSDSPIISDEIAKEFKSLIGNALVCMWRTCNDIDDEDMQLLMSHFRYLCRSRKGEVWTLEKQAAARKTTEDTLALLGDTAYKEV